MIRRAVRKATPAEVVDPGDYAIFDLHHDRPASGIEFMCPHPGCGDKTHLPLKAAHPGGWEWDEATKTLVPSILRQDERRCQHHFSLINGEWVP